MRISIAVYDKFEIVVSQQAPAIRADSLVVFLDKVRTTLGIAFARQLHHLGPLVQGSVTVALRGIVIITIALNLRVIFLILKTPNHISDVKVLGHNF